jgi:replicative DNA helicase
MVGVSTALERLPPQNVEAEQALLGSLLLDRDAIIRVATTISAADFYRQSHAQIYQAIVDLYNKRVPADYMTVADELSRRGQLDEIGGLSYLFSLLNSVPTAVHAEYYAGLVADRATRRRLITAGTEVVTLGYDEARDLDEVLDKAEQAIFDVAQSREVRDYQPISAVLERYFERIDFVHQHKGDLLGVPTGFRDLDKLTGGLQKSDLIILAARPSTGKTSLALGFAYNAAVRFGQKVGIYSLEMSAEQLVQRLLAMETGVDSHRLRQGYIDDEEWDRVSRAFGKLAEARIFIDDTAGLSISELRSRARRLVAEQGLDLLLLDYLQLMQGRRTDNRVQEISEISRGLKALARELNLPVVALSQLSRAVEARTDHVPKLSDLRESGCLTGDTLIYLPEEGVSRRIDSLVGRHSFLVLALNTDTWRLEPRLVLNAFATGRKPVYRLTTRHGRSIRATANHRFLTVHGWRRLDQLAPGQRLALPRRLPSPGRATLSDAELALLGHLIGDGCTLPTHAIQYTTNDLTLAETVVDLATHVFGAAIAPRIERQRDWYQVYLPPSYHLTHGVRNPVGAWLGRLDVFGLRSHEKRVPDEVFAQRASGIACFLRHLWATDGCIHFSHGVKHYTGIYYATSSLRLARQVQSLLLRLEINAILSRHDQPGKGRPQYHVTITGKSAIERFFDQVGALGQQKALHRQAIADHLAHRVANTNRDVLPRDLWRLVVVPAMQAAGLTSRQMQAGLGNAYCGTGLYKQNLGRERAARLAQVVRSEPLARLAHSDVYWDEITSIEPDGEEDVYDLTVDGLHNFVANDIIVHNSIEQDADIVMFIYREEMYDQETEKKGIAEIHVAKHRNGPVGVVPLRFFTNTAKFADLELYRQPE